MNENTKECLLCQNAQRERDTFIAAKKKRQDRIDELTARIPTGTVCTETNCCGGFLTEQEVDELEGLFRDKGNAGE